MDKLSKVTISGFIVPTAGDYSEAPVSMFWDGTEYQFSIGVSGTSINVTALKNRDRITHRAMLYELLGIIFCNISLITTKIQEGAAYSDDNFYYNDSQKRFCFMAKFVHETRKIAPTTISLSHDFRDTHGLPYDIIFEFLMSRNLVPDWTRLYFGALATGTSHERILSAWDADISDTFGSKMRDVVLSTLEEIHKRYEIQNV